MNFEKQIAATRGAFSALFTPFDEQGRVHDEMLVRIANFQLANGIRGFFVNGSTGEGLLLNFEERVKIVEILIRNFAEKAVIIVNVAHPSTDESVRLAKAAANAGADWISSTPPIYHGTTFEGTQRHYAAIASATDLPFMLYALNGIVDPVRDTALFELPSVCGIKFTGSNFFSVQQLQRNLKKRIAKMSGFDEQFVASQLFGFDGGIGSTYNFAPAFYSTIYDLCQSNDFAKAAQLQEKINRVTQLMVQHENWSYRKAIMKFLGMDCGWCRAPYASLSDKEFAHFVAKLDNLEVLAPLDNKMCQRVD